MSERGSEQQRRTTPGERVLGSVFGGRRFDEESPRPEGGVAVESSVEETIVEETIVEQTVNDAVPAANSTEASAPPTDVEPGDGRGEDATPAVDKPKRGRPRRVRAGDAPENEPSPIPAGEDTPLGRDPELPTVKVAFNIPEDLAHEVVNASYLLRKHHGYTPRQGSRSNVAALALEMFCKRLAEEAAKKKT